MNKKDFKQYMKRGLGRCVLTLRNSADIEKYKDIVLWGCLHNLSYDVQCEGTRALYVYKLTRFFDDDDYFLIPIIKAFCDSTGSLTKPFSHYLELLNYFAEDGNKTAKEALHKKYDELFVLLLNKRNFKKYDINRDNYEAICVFLISFGGKAGFLRVVRDIGRLFTENPHYDIGYFEWFCSSVRLAIGEKRIRTLLKEESKKSDYVRCFYEEYLNEEKNFNRFPKKPIEIPKLDDLKKQVLETGQLQPSLRVRFIRNASLEEKTKLAEEIVSEEDLSVKAELLSVFAYGTEEIPLYHEAVIENSKSDCERLKSVSFDVLANCKSGSVRQYALSLIDSRKHVKSALKMLIRNYTPKDKQLLLDELCRFKKECKNDDYLHEIGNKILDSKKYGKKLPKEFFIYVYNETPCSLCRECVVRALAKRRMLPKEIIEECRYDSNSDISKYVKRYYPENN